jgi:hypothetical protein
MIPFEGAEASGFQDGLWIWRQEPFLLNLATAFERLAIERRRKEAL